jgi:hypothetical protein
MFTPVIDLEVKNKATVLAFSDITGEDTVYATAGTGWDGGAGIDSTSVSAAELTVTDPNGDDVTIDCLADILAADPVTADAVIDFDEETGEWVDGYYTAVYDVYMVVDAYTAVADNGDGTVRITAAGHAVVTGQKVTITGVSGDYDGDYDAVWNDANTFDIAATFTATDSGAFTPYYSNTFYPFIYANVEMALERMYAVFAAMDEGHEADEYLKQCELVKGLYNALKSALATASTTVVNNIYGRITRILDFNSIELTYS